MARLGRAQPFAWKRRTPVVAPAAAAGFLSGWASDCNQLVIMLRKNVGSQVLTFNLVNATTGAALLSATVTTKVTLDGTQGAGAGTVTELGTGQYKYVPTQGETNGASVGCSFTATNAVPVNLHCFTIGQDPALSTLDVNVLKLLGTAWLTPGTAGTPDVNAKLLGGTAQTGRDIGASVLLSSGTGTGQLSITSGIAKVDVDTIKTNPVVNGGTITFPTTATLASTTNITAGTITTVGTLTTYTGNTVQTGDAYARLGAPAGASVSADIAAAKVDTAAIKVATDKLTFTVANQIDANVLDWKSATAPAMTGDAFARLGAPAGASVSADVAAVKVDTAAIKAKTDNLPSDPADESLIIAATDAITSAVAAVQADTDDIQSRLPAALVSGRIDASVGAMAANTMNASALATDAVTEIWAKACTEPTAVVAASPTAIAALSWLTTLSRNQIEQTATTQTLRADDATTAIAAAAVSDDGTTATKGEFA